MHSVVVTGVSRGIGAALFEQLHSSGARILALGRTFSPAQLAAQEADPARIVLRTTDLGNPASLPTTTDLAAFTDGATEVTLIHNGAALAPVGAVGALDPAEILHAVTANLAAPMLLTNALLGSDLRTQTALTVTPVERDVRVLFISSLAAHTVVGGAAVYSATKRGGEYFFEVLAAQYANDPRVRVVNIDPGAVGTAMQAQVRDYAAQDVYFPMRDIFVGLHQSGQLAPPALVAAQILAEHLPAR